MRPLKMGDGDANNSFTIISKAKSKRRAAKELKYLAKAMNNGDNNPKYWTEGLRLFVNRFAKPDVFSPDWVRVSIQDAVRRLPPAFRDDHPEIEETYEEVINRLMTRCVTKLQWEHPSTRYDISDWVDCIRSFSQYDFGPSLMKISFAENQEGRFKLAQAWSMTDYFHIPLGAYVIGVDGDDRDYPMREHLFKQAMRISF